MKPRRMIVRAVALCGLAALLGTASAADLGLHSSAFNDGQSIPKRYSCDGAGVSPPLRISGVPRQAKTLVLLVDDPDAPSGDWSHWVLYNIDPDLVVLAPGAASQRLPGPAITAANSYHDRDYGAVCPPRVDGAHHYRFTLYALDTRLGANPSDQAAVEKAMQGHILARARLTGIYTRD
ncbi:YbhB/YbcL family Raf kinase inhibitor-like protein [Salinisphaera sp. SPP-AMP-43]|uniref:YbhB/YbcL family Raf kinase inhibitor-like protein n=1 Tax=Salinisphaera sp. SPP-AMP-43 TaxID=3121288 RepID=UPI003C6E5E7E